MQYAGSERRKYPRYDTELKLYYNVKYELKMRVIFRVMGSAMKSLVMHRYSGVSKNISAEGLCFVSKKRLKAGDILQLEVYAPNSKVPVKMEGEVRWCTDGDGKNMFQTGVKLTSVNGRSVMETIYFDKEYKVVWSEVLNAIFSNFAAMIKEHKKK